MHTELLQFGHFRLYADRRLLLRDNVPIRLGSRAYDILLALIERAGEVVSKEELIARVWPETFVEQANLRVHIAALRKALGEDQAHGRFVENIPGRGYSFVAQINRDLVTDRVAGVVKAAARPSELPISSSRVFGRQEIVRDLTTLLSKRRMVTIVGPGGIGKTTVALAAARILEPNYPDGVISCDLSSVRDPGLLPGTIARQLGHAIRTDDALRELTEVLYDRPILLVLDSCEPFIEEAASLAETLLQRTAGVTILATSREPLRIADEWVQQLAALDVPRLSEVIQPEEALKYSAIELFAERASASLGGYVLVREDVPAVIEICRRLDGIPLALELAAARLNAAGLNALARSLDDRFHVLTRGRRTALPRHRTLRAAHDWSYDLLTEAEQFVFRHLSVFSGDLTLGAAQAVAVASDVSVGDIDEDLASLAAKSLLAPVQGRGELAYRFLDTTRAYASDRLVEASEQPAAKRRHAEFFMHLFQRAESEWDTRPTSEWLADYGEHLDDVRLALDWASGEAGDARVGVALTVATIPIWFLLGLLDECLSRVQWALQALSSLSGDIRRWNMQLCAALGWPQMKPIARLQTGPAAWHTTLAIAEEIGDSDYQERALWALWVDAHNRGEPREALVIAERFRALSETTMDQAARAVGHRMRAKSLLLLGAPGRAYDEISIMLRDYLAPQRRSHTARLQYDQVVTAHITLQRSLWLKGQPDAAMRDVDGNVQTARKLGHGLTLSHALSDGACPVALMARDLPAAQTYIAMLYEHTSAHALDVWHAYAEAYDGQLHICRGEMSEGIRLLRGAVATLREGGFVLYLTSFLGTLGGALASIGEEREGLGLIDEALGRCERSGEAWCLAELWRLKGVSLASPANTEGKASLLRALDIARSQGALSWELRAASSLAQLHAENGDRQTAVRILSPVLARFTEGFDRPDIADARAALSAWHPIEQGEMREG